MLTELGGKVGNTDKNLLELDVLNIAVGEHIKENCRLSNSKHSNLPIRLYLFSALPLAPVSLLVS